MLFGAATRFLACTVVVLVLSYTMPGFAAGGFSGAIPAALAAAVSGYIIERVLARPPRPMARALVGFITCAAATYLTQFFVPGMAVPVAGALVTGVVVGFADFLVPAEAR